MELACSTTLAPGYHPALLERLVDTTTNDGHRPILVFVVCGGFKIDLETVADYQRWLIQEPGLSEEWTVEDDDGALFNFRK